MPKFLVCRSLDLSFLERFQWLVPSTKPGDSCSFKQGIVWVLLIFCHLPSIITGNTCKHLAFCKTEHCWFVIFCLVKQAGQQQIQKCMLSLNLNKCGSLPAGGQQCPFPLNYILNNFPSNGTEYVSARGSPSKPHSCCSWGDQLSLHSLKLFWTQHKQSTQRSSGISG